MPHASSKRWLAGGALAVAGALLTLMPAPAMAEPARFVAPAVRESAPARPVGVLVAQPHLASSIELGRIAFPGWGGGALGAIIIASTNDIPQRLAEAAIARSETRIAPLRAELEDFDAAALAGDATLAALAGTVWLGASPPDMLTLGLGNAGEVPRPVLVSRTYRIGLWGAAPNTSAASENWTGDVAALEEQFALAHADAGERVQVLWRYQMAPDFSAVQVFADISIRRRGVAEPFYVQQVISVVRLNRPALIEEDNVTRWAANDGTLARRALQMAFARAGEVLPQVLALDEAGFIAATDRRRETATAAGYHGPLLVRDNKGPVFWAEDGDQRLAAFVATQTIRE